MTVPTGGAADEVAAEVIDGDLVGAEGLNVGAGAVREAGDLAEGDALGLDLVEGFAAVEHGLVEPPPGALPAAAGVDGERVEDDGEGGEAAEGRLRLRLEAGDQGKEALHGARRQGLREEALALRRGEVHRRRRREDPPVQRRHGRRHPPPPGFDCAGAFLRCCLLIWFLRVNTAAAGPRGAPPPPRFQFESVDD